MTAKPTASRANCRAETAPLVAIDATHLGAGTARATVAATGRWFVLHTRPRQEKAIARVLEQRAIEVFLPLSRTVRYYGHRKRIVRQPLFSSYVFVRGSIEQTYDALATGRVVNLIHCADQRTLDRELGQIRSALARGAQLQPHARLVRGCHVRVKAGPFAGLEGMIEHRPRPDRLILQVETLSRAASLEIDADLLEPVD